MVIMSAVKRLLQGVQSLACPVCGARSFTKTCFAACLYGRPPLAVWILEAPDWSRISNGEFEFHMGSNGPVELDFHMGSCMEKSTPESGDLIWFLSVSV